MISYFSYLGEREGSPFVFESAYQVENGSSILHIYTTNPLSVKGVLPLLGLSSLVVFGTSYTIVNLLSGYMLLP